MKNAILDLWNGNIAPCEHCGSHDAELNHLLSLMERNKNDLCRTITPQQKEILDKYTDCADEYLLRSMELAFCDGFCIAAQLWTDALHSH